MGLSLHLATPASQDEGLLLASCRGAWRPPYLAVPLDVFCFRRLAAGGVAAPG